MNKEKRWGAWVCFSFLLAPFSLSAAPRVVDRLRIFPESAPVALSLACDDAAPPAAASLVRRGPAGDAPAGERPLAWKDGRAALDLGRLPRGYYELRWDGRDPEVAPTAFVVTFDPAARPPVDPARARIATDGALAWLVRHEDYDAVAQAMRLCGAAWVRDRLSWGHVEPEPGHFKWGNYERAVDAQQRAGLRIVTVFHDTTHWARPEGKPHKSFPDDLRHAFRFGRTLAEHFRGRIQAYEIWNEADIAPFAIETADRYAPFLKAAYLGVKAGDPGAAVLMNSFAVLSRNFGEVLFENEIGGYTDAYNHHLYRPADQHPATAGWHRALARPYGLDGLPSWVTEAGIALPDRSGRLDEADRWKQAEFVAKSYARSLAAGVDRHFYFIFPYYKEGATDFGLLDADLAPTPGAAAFATLSCALGAAQPLGEGVLAAPDVAACFFDAGPWRAAVLWRDAGTREVAIPTQDPAVRGWTLTGEPLALRAGDGAVTLTLGPSPIYLLAGDLRPARAHRDDRAAPAPSAPAGLPRVVLRLNLPRDRAVFKDQFYALTPGADVAATVEAWNFGEAAVKGTVKAACVVPAEPAASLFRVDPAEVPVEIPPLGHAAVPVTIRVPAAGKNRVGRVTARLEAEGRASSVASLRIAFDPQRLAYPVAEALPLDPARWTPKASPNGEARLSAAGSRTGEAPPASVLRAEIVFARPGDRWAYPEIVFDPPRDVSRFDALRLCVRVVEAGDDLTMRVQFEEAGGVRYFTVGGREIEEAGTFAWVIPFTELEHAHFSPPDPDGRLNLERLAKILVGVNQKGDRTVFELERAELVDTREAEVRD